MNDRAKKAAEEIVEFIRIGCDVDFSNTYGGNEDDIPTIASIIARHFADEPKSGCLRLEDVERIVTRMCSEMCDDHEIVGLDATQIAELYDKNMRAALKTLPGTDYEIVFPDK